MRPIEGQIDDLIGEINAAHRPKRAGAGDDPDQEDGGGLDRLSAKGGYQGALHALATSAPWSGWRSSGTCGWGSSTCWWASTCCARDWICRRSVAGGHSGRGQGGLPALARPVSDSDHRPRGPQRRRAGSSCTPTRSPPPCGLPSTRQRAAARFRMPTIKPTASSRRPSSSPCGI